MMESPNSYLEWLKKLPENDVDYPVADCLECGSKGLSLQYFSAGNDEYGWKLVWCASCNSGIRISRTKIPEGAVPLVGDDAQKEFLDSLSNLTLIN